MVSGLVKTADLFGANFSRHTMDGIEPRMEGWIEIVHVVA